ncbi:MAG: hypothetical protein LBJ65_03985 [Burkholderia sp.]|uniref:hypothetical protein n=1 Tax=Burkholderia sp. TaxID=36773 RepID=UPI00282CD8BF|nr:hypothetical protein [Burkholderia sp.]MDR0240744.1 hypothetical protein [Burkholderia sp.]
MLTLGMSLEIVVEPAGINWHIPDTFQYPALNDMLAPFAEVPDASDTPARFVGVGYSPTLPAIAFSFVAMPTIPAVLDGVGLQRRELAGSSSRPDSGGEARAFEKPVPLTVPLAVIPSTNVAAPVEALTVNGVSRAWNAACACKAGAGRPAQRVVRAAATWHRKCCDVARRARSAWWERQAFRNQVMTAQ